MCASSMAVWARLANNVCPLAVTCSSRSTSAPVTAAWWCNPRSAVCCKNSAHISLLLVGKQQLCNVAYKAALLLHLTETDGKPGFR